VSERRLRDVTSPGVCLCMHACVHIPGQRHSVTGFSLTFGCYFVVFFRLGSCRLHSRFGENNRLFRVYFNRFLGRKSQWRVQRVLSVGTKLTRRLPLLHKTAFCNDNIILFCAFFAEYITAVSLKIVDLCETLFPDPDRDFAPTPAGQRRVQMGDEGCASPTGIQQFLPVKIPPAYFLTWRDFFYRKCIESVW